MPSQFQATDPSRRRPLHGCAAILPFIYLSHSFTHAPNARPSAMESPPAPVHSPDEPAFVRLHDEDLSTMESSLRQFKEDLKCLNKTENASQTKLLLENKDSFALCPSEELLARENATLWLEAKVRMSSPEFFHQRQAREFLPTWKVRQNIVDTIAKHRVVVLTGETGCGKTTQVPQYILEEAELQGVGATCQIVVTQPRRLTAFRVAERVAWERGEPVGKSVGYMIRLGSIPPRGRGSILYCTTSILLRRLQRAGGIVGVSHVIIDEVHERDVDTEFLLALLHELMHAHSTLRVIVMSAIPDASKLTRYFGGCPHISIPGMLYPVRIFFTEDIKRMAKKKKVSAPTIARLNTQSEEENDAVSAVNVISWLCTYFVEGNGAILCFLPGRSTITVVKERLLETCRHLNLMVIPLHSQLQPGEQSVAFIHPPNGMRKVILATNIAETSVNFDDVVYVIDSGKVTAKQFVPCQNMSEMKVQWICKESVRHRQGRAGRVQPGYCFHLYSRKILTWMADHQIPEIQRVPLEELCLQVKAIAASKVILNIEEQMNRSTDECLCISNGRKTTSSDLTTFFSKMLEPPKATVVFSAIKVLQQLGAIDRTERLTPLGKTLSDINIHPRFGKMLLYGAFLNCLDPILTVAAAVCFRDPFLAPMHAREYANKTRTSFSVNGAYGSDHLVFASAYEQWMAANTIGQGYLFCEKHFLSPATMSLITGMRKEFERAIIEAKVLDEEMVVPSFQEQMHIARCLLAAGFYPNIARLGEGKAKGMRTAYQWRQGVYEQRLVVHPNSVVSQKQLKNESENYLVFQEKVMSKQCYVQGCNLVPPLSLLLFGWDVCESQDSGYAASGDWMVLEVEGWLKFLLDRRAGTLLLKLREALETIMRRWMSGYIHTQAERNVLQVVSSLLLGACHGMFQGPT